MSKELVIASNRHETKVGILEDDQLVEVYFQRANEYSLAGSIHKGRVTRVLPGMQSAFVDLGLERDTFLYVSDFFEEHPEEFDPVSESGPASVAVRGPERAAAGPEQREQRDRDPRDRDRRDRRDRGGRDRGPRPERAGGRSDQPRPTETAPVFSVPSTPESLNEESEAQEVLAEALASALELSALPVPDASPAPSEVSPEGRPFGERGDRNIVDRPNGDRDRGGDRKRRSRRRRTRGGGFPENKYAQPGSALTSGSVPPVVSFSSAPHPEKFAVDLPPEPPREIILLPGESLAKYRNAPVAHPVPPQAHFAAKAPAEIEVPEIEDEVEAPQDEAFEDDREAESSEVESSIEEHQALSHDESPAIHPEVYPRDEYDLPDDNPGNATLSAERVASDRQPLTIESASAATPLTASELDVHHEPLSPPESPLPYRLASLSRDREELEHQAHLAAKLADEIRGDKVEPEIADDEELDLPAYLEEELADTDTVFAETSEFPEVDAFEGDDTVDDDQSELEAAVSESIEPPHLLVPVNPLEPGAPPPLQQAVVRDQGNRSPHRMGRRMRRRRGGRGGQSSGDAFAPHQAGHPGHGQPPPQQGPAHQGSTEVLPSPAVQGFAPEAREGEFRSEARPEARVDARVDPRSDPRGDRAEARGEPRGDSRDRPRSEVAMPSISDLLKPGQEIIVQIAKEPLGQKGARITSHIALPGRYVVFMPSVDHLGVSRKIESDEERLRLKRILQAHRASTTGGFICRTAGAGHTEEEIAADMSFLYNLWLDIRQKAEKRPAPALLHHDLDVVQRILRDQLTDEYKAIWVDNEDLYESALRFVQRFQPALVGRVKMYTRSAPIFDAFGITQELEKALRPKVWLKSGGYIVINQTEALVAIDVNTGKYVGKSNRLEDTIVKTNTEAVKEIVRQVRLRDLGGIIVVDFIDMDERKNRQKVMAVLEEAMQSDKAPYKILQFNDFGLVAITRKRVKQSLERTLCAPCPYCEGAGYVKSVQTIIGEILIEAQKIARAVEGKDVMLRVHPDVAKVLKSNNNQYLEELEEILGRPVLVVGDAALHHEKFDLA